MSSVIKENLKIVQENIQESITKRNNSISDDVLLVAVTKIMMLMLCEKLLIQVA